MRMLRLKQLSQISVSTDSYCCSAQADQTLRGVTVSTLQVEGESGARWGERWSPTQLSAEWSWLTSRWVSMLGSWMLYCCCCCIVVVYDVGGGGVGGGEMWWDDVMWPLTSVLQCWLTEDLLSREEDTRAHWESSGSPCTEGKQWGGSTSLPPSLSPLPSPPSAGLADTRHPNVSLTNSAVTRTSTRTRKLSLTVCQSVLAILLEISISHSHTSHSLTLHRAGASPASNIH